MNNHFLSASGYPDSEIYPSGPFTGSDRYGSPRKTPGFSQKQKTSIFDYLGKRTIYSEIIDPLCWPIVS
jgi:hypothetical protein